MDLLWVNIWHINHFLLRLNYVEMFEHYLKLTLLVKWLSFSSKLPPWLTEMTQIPMIEVGFRQPQKTRHAVKVCFFSLWLIFLHNLISGRGFVVLYCWTSLKFSTLVMSYNNLTLPALQTSKIVVHTVYFWREILIKK